MHYEHQVCKCHMQLKNLESMNNNGDFCLKCYSYVLQKVNNDLVSLDVLKLVNTKDGKTTQRGSGSKLPLFVVQAVMRSREKGQQKQPHVNIKPLATTKAWMT